MHREELLGHAIETDDDELRIDGHVIPYLSTDAGWQIYYEPPKPTLLQAARSYVETQSGGESSRTEARVAPPAAPVEAAESPVAMRSVPESTQRQEVGGHIVEIDGGVLRVDGESVPYSKTGGGYQIYYEPPKPTLIDAAKSFLETQFGRD